MKQIPLTQGKYAIVDDEDYDRLMAMGKWHFNGIYAAKSITYRKPCGSMSSRTIIMHRFISKAPKGLEVDHEDGNGLNNQKQNIRVCTTSQNQKNRGKQANNTSGFKGVTWNKRVGRWYAQIQNNKKQISIGLFDCPIEAAKAYNAAAIKYHGEFAKINQITW